MGGGALNRGPNFETKKKPEQSDADIEEYQQVQRKKDEAERLWRALKGAAQK